MTILKLIKAQCRIQGVPEKYAEQIEKMSGITEEKDGNIPAAVKNFKEFVYPIIEDSKDTATKAAKEAIEEYEKKHGLKEGKAVEDPTNLPSDIDPSIKAMIESQQKSIEGLTLLVEKVTKQQSATTALQNVKQQLEGKIDKEFIDRYAKRVNLQAEDLDAEIESAVKEFQEDKQMFLVKAVASGKYQPAEGAVTDEEFNDYLKMTSKKESEFQSVKLR